MKRIILLVIAMVMTIGIAEISAASNKTKQVNIETTQFKTDIDCEGCVNKIMNYMPTQKGIKDVKVDLPKKTVTISYDIDKTANKTIIKRFKSIGVQASVIEEKKTVSQPVSNTSNNKNNSSNNNNNNNKR